jgi:nitrate reductase beta subunit
MVWYVPPLSPVESLGEELVRDGGRSDHVFAAIEELRIPVEYLASFLSAGDPAPVRRSLRRLVAMRRYMRAKNVDGEVDPEIAREVGMDPTQLEEMFRMVAIGDYDERYVIPKRHGEASPEAFADQGSCGIDFARGSATVLPSDAFAAQETEAPEAAPDFDIRDYLVRRGGDGNGGGTGNANGGAGNGNGANGGGGRGA